MGLRDPRVDDYIAAAHPFARPILEHLRAVVHAACPDVRETIKWRFPNFEHHGLLCSMAAFKAHCAFGFWRAEQVLEAVGGPQRDSMGSFGRITSIADLPPKRALITLIRKAVALNEAAAAGAAPARARTAAKRGKPELPVPDDLTAALARSKKARATFDAFPPSHRREYLEWILEAKRADTRARRIAQAVAWMAEGRHRNWKYERGA